MPEKRPAIETWYRDIKGEWYKITGIERFSEADKYWPFTQQASKFTKVHFMKDDLTISYFLHQGHLDTGEVLKKCIETEQAWLSKTKGKNMDNITDTDRLDFVLHFFSSIDFYEYTESWEMVIAPQYNVAGAWFKGVTRRECIDRAIKERRYSKNANNRND